MSSGWSDEAVGALKELIRNPDLSYEQIGQDPRISMTRSAVCGKVHRLGLGRAVNTSAARNKVRIKMAQEARAASRPAQAMPQTGDFARIMADHKVEAEVRPLKSLGDLGDDECHFVFGDPRESREVYCGKPAVPGLAYCDGCHRRVYEVVEVARPYVALGSQQEKERHVRVDA